MKLTTRNFWDYDGKADVICIPVPAIWHVKDTALQQHVIAKEAARRYPDCMKQAQTGNSSGGRPFFIARGQGNTRLLSLPYSEMDNDDISFDVLYENIETIKNVAYRTKWNLIAIPEIGWDEVPIDSINAEWATMLSDIFHVVNHQTTAANLRHERGRRIYRRQRSRQ